MYMAGCEARISNQNKLTRAAVTGLTRRVQSLMVLSFQHN